MPGDLLTAGVTTAVGVLGFDGVTRNIAEFSKYFRKKGAFRQGAMRTYWFWTERPLNLKWSLPEGKFLSKDAGSYAGAGMKVRGMEESGKKI